MLKAFILQSVAPHVSRALSAMPNKFSVIVSECQTTSSDFAKYLELSFYHHYLRSR